MKIKIEHSIPLPRRRSPRGELEAIVSRLKVGDSFLYPLRNRFSPWWTAQRIGIKLASRKIDADTVRIWRIA